MKRLFVMGICVCMLIGMASLSTGAGMAQAASNSYGLTVSADGRIQMQGEDFYGFGCNAFMLLDSCLTDPFYNVDGAFATMSKYNIPVVRVPFGSGSASGFQMWQDEPDTYYTYLDLIVRAAEKYHVGIIATITWWFPYVNDICKEQVYKIGDTSSKSYEFAMKYTADIVKRYADSPAIFGWEVTNEINLCADLCGSKDWAPFGSQLTEVNGYDFYTTDEAVVFLKGVAETIRQNDPYHRMISNGNAKLPANQMNKKYSSDNMNTATHTWTVSFQADTLKEFQDISAYYAPDPIDTMSAHIGQNELGYADFSCLAWGQTVSYLDYLQACVNAASLGKKALYLGEFGDLGTNDWDASKLQQNKTILRKYLDDTKAAGVQLATTWQFAFDTTNKAYVGDDSGLYTYLLQQMKEENNAFAAAGKQNLDAYWSGVTPAFYKVQGSTTSTTAANAISPDNTASDSAELSNASSASSVESATTDSTLDTNQTSVSAKESATTAIASGVSADDSSQGSSNGGWLLLLLGAVVVIGGGGVAAFLLIKRRRAQAGQ